MKNRFSEENIYLDKWVENRFWKDNIFPKKEKEEKSLPSYEEVKKILPEPFWENNETAIQCWNKTWELAFKNLRRPSLSNNFITNYIDTAFNDNLFMWDSCFILMFCRYARRAFDFQKTLDNFYSLQHPDGFICREIREKDGSDRFHRFDPSSTGPNIFAWCEWEHYLNTGDTERLKKIFFPLAAYHEWMRIYRTWQDGTLWSTGWGCGMDNQPRTPIDYNPIFQHGHMSWIDTTCQHILSAKILAMIAEKIGLKQEIDNFLKEAEKLTLIVNKKFWDKKKNFYFDRFRDGSLSNVMTVGAFWALLAGIVPKNKLLKFVSHLKDKKSFNRPHRVPALSKENKAYSPDGDYWNGGVWAPTNYMVLRGLTKNQFDDLAFEIASNHYFNVLEVFKETNTLWENYAPEKVSFGNPAKKDFVGWSGLTPVAVLLEYIFGLRPDASKKILVWDIRLTDAHGIKRYPFGKDGVIDLFCERRSSQKEEPKISISSTIPLNIEIRWLKGKKIIPVKPL